MMNTRLKQDEHKIILRSSYIILCLSAIMLKKTDIAHIAKLARIKLTQEEEKQLEQELSSVLNYVEKLKKVDISGVIPVSHSNNIVNVTREDKAFSFNSQDKNKLMNLAPARKEGLIKVKPVF